MLALGTLAVKSFYYIRCLFPKIKFRGELNVTFVFPRTQTKMETTYCLFEAKTHVIKAGCKCFIATLRNTHITSIFYTTSGCAETSLIPIFLLIHIMKEYVNENSSGESSSVALNPANFCPVKI